MTPEQKVKAATRVELEKLLAADKDHKAQLSFEELTTVCCFVFCSNLIKVEVRSLFSIFALFR